MMTSLRVCLTSVLGAGVFLANPVRAYPGGTPDYVTDVAPFCAACHASVNPQQLQGVPDSRVKKELPEGKHIARIRAARAGSPYAKITPEQREELIRGIRAIDAGSSLKLMAPSRLKVGQVFEVTLEATGGGGPVVGLGLVDADQRWQARPAPSAGWQVIAAPQVTGPDGKPQTRFTQRRNPKLAPGLSYVNVYGVHADPGQHHFDTVHVTYRLRAPAWPGRYPLAGVFWYGTEKGSPNGGVETVQGRSPLGGFVGAGGRIRFSPVLTIQVSAD